MYGGCAQFAADKILFPLTTEVVLAETLYKGGQITLPVLFPWSEASIGHQNRSTDKSWVSFAKFRKFSIKWALKLSDLDQGEWRNLHLKIVTCILKSGPDCRFYLQKVPKR